MGEKMQYINKISGINSNVQLVRNKHMNVLTFSTEQSLKFGEKADVLSHLLKRPITYGMPTKLVQIDNSNRNTTTSAGFDIHPGRFY